MMRLMNIWCGRHFDGSSVYGEFCCCHSMFSHALYWRIRAFSPNFREPSRRGRWLGSGEEEVVSGVCYFCF